MAVTSRDRGVKNNDRPGRKPVKPPEDPASVGWTRAQRVRLVETGETFRLEAGGEVSPVDVEYETYGELNPAGDNAILLLHALSGDAHAAGWDAGAEAEGRKWRTRKPGWWDEMIGPGLPLDTRKYQIICSNVLGSCYGTTGPDDIDPDSGKPYGLRFPVVTIGDWVRLQARLLDHLGIDRVYAVLGGSLGGQQALEWALAYPDRVGNALVLAASARLSTQGLAFNAVARYSILSDPHFNEGDYYGSGGPAEGLAAARMLGHITYLSEAAMHEKFGRRLQDKSEPDFNFGIEFEVESYLAYQGRSFVERFDANAYLYITRAMDYYDAVKSWGRGDLTRACSRIKSRMMIVSFTSDWLYTPKECRKLALAVCRSGRPVTYVSVPSDYGHDSFLVETEKVGRLVRDFLASGRKNG
ncbi:MAG: homoserine O-acetyltransferase [Candidatus Glassbacteria bacterium]|nr:homoserine O-acetyltransferase [Candidatus Glassbacteria bacterium]